MADETAVPSKYMPANVVYGIGAFTQAQIDQAWPKDRGGTWSIYNDTAVAAKAALPDPKRSGKMPQTAEAINRARLKMVPGAVNYSDETMAAAENYKPRTMADMDTTSYSLLGQAPTSAISGVSPVVEPVPTDTSVSIPVSADPATIV